MKSQTSWWLHGMATSGTPAVDLSQQWDSDMKGVVGTPGRDQAQAQRKAPAVGIGLVAKSCPTLATPWTIACHDPLTMGLSRQEYWSGLPFPSPGDLPDPGIKSGSPALQADSLPTEL